MCVYIIRQYTFGIINKDEKRLNPILGQDRNALPCIRYVWNNNNNKIVGYNIFNFFPFVIATGRRRPCICYIAVRWHCLGRAHTSRPCWVQFFLQWNTTTTQPLSSGRHDKTKINLLFFLRKTCIVAATRALWFSKIQNDDNYHPAAVLHCNRLKGRRRRRRRPQHETKSRKNVLSVYSRAKRLSLMRNIWGRRRRYTLKKLRWPPQPRRYHLKFNLLGSFNRHRHNI